MKLAVHNITGKETSKKVDLSNDIFGIEPNDHAIYLDVKQYLAAQRSGTHKSKGRSEVKGSTRKLRKQKGGGGARVGDIKNPLFRGGGRVFGPVPRSYDFKVNKKVKRLARKSALSHKAKDMSIIVLEDFNFEKPNTKSYSDFLSNFDLLDNKTVLVLAESNKNIFLSSRNLKKAKVVLASELNTYDVMNANKLMIMESSINEIEKNF
ncbi:MAG: 50S ribosomal protein L4 [Cryomorphaceae bacterium BACL11 MAG-121128-bin16]|jgi:large subunit ribosomal protein L4|nr:MAG: 50S ribosomal protein L4 [Cryomorphaceae bacterium BACL11 MAG-121015-bin20]KRO70814.1 MAG: 50S ribosomal protein L4 [Cryomorphaceae bacterium BACL11 MAG-121128-bin16]MBC8474229.1 50S ribosomal protein L4 [Cryomorphaceae bacterium]MDA1008954.1 50S ribosomal protein L4 [Bacteroidota bacterium]